MSSMSAALSPSPSQAASSAPNPVRESSNEPDLTATTPSPTGPPAEAGPDSSMTSMPTQPLPVAHPPAEAETQTRLAPDTPISSPGPLPAETRPPEPAASPAPIDTAPRVEFDVPAFSSFPLPVAVPPRASVTISTHGEQRPLPPIPSSAVASTPVETSPRLYRNRSNAYPHRNRPRSVPPTPRPLNFPVATRRLVSAPSEGVDAAEWSPVADLHEDRLPTGTVGARLEPTMAEALSLRDQALWQATWTMYSINIAIALQVGLGALTTAFAGSLRGDHIRVSVAVLGSFATLVASFLARMRGSSEPEKSFLREQALSNFIRKLDAFILDHGSESGSDYDQSVDHFRSEFERLLLTPNPSERRNAPPLDQETKIDETAKPTGDTPAVSRRKSVRSASAMA